MELINQYFEIEEFDSDEMVKRMEKAGRTCYKSENKITLDSASNFIKSIIKNEHHTILEHEKITARIICNRGVSHELVRHRLASYSQESTRYCNYNKKGITMIIPHWSQNILSGKYNTTDLVEFYLDNCVLDSTRFTKAEKIWLHSMLKDEQDYNDLIEEGLAPQDARGVLPIDVKTEIVITANLREWRHILSLRALGTTGKPHPQMEELMIGIFKKLEYELPEVFGDFPHVR